MFQEVVIILESFGYKVDFSPYHTDVDVKKYASRPDQVSGEKFLTVYSPDGYVVGRVHALKEKGKFHLSHLEVIIGFFKMFEIPHRSSIVVQLEKLTYAQKR